MHIQKHTMFLIDDVVLRAVGISLKPFDMIWMLELLRNYALQEKYNLQKIGSQIKENRLLFEIGEITKEEYLEAKELSEKRKLPFVDCLNAIQARNNKATIVSQDEHFTKNLSDIVKVIKPQNL